ncbi:hypothetical protein GQ600_1563 [Phytophthora cactorum]|nr:hypothetical protein GQ600_1563 [Phytophthora cactorum]
MEIWGQSAAVTVDEIIQFLEAEFFYGVILTFFYDLHNCEQYPPAKGTMSFARYSSILAVMGAKSVKKQNNISNLWAPPFSDTTHAAAIMQRLCADIGFVPGTTFASLDDDLIRLHSSSVYYFWLAHVRNPKHGVL